MSKPGAVALNSGSRDGLIADVAIAGGGVAGLYAAWRLATGGLRGEGAQRSAWPCSRQRSGSVVASKPRRFQGSRGTVRSSAPCDSPRGRSSCSRSPSSSASRSSPSPWATSTTSGTCEGGDCTRANSRIRRRFPTVSRAGSSARRASSCSITLPTRFSAIGRCRPSGAPGTSWRSRSDTAAVPSVNSASGTFWPTSSRRRP